MIDDFLNNLYNITETIRLGGKTMFRKLIKRNKTKINQNDDLDIHNLPEHIAIIMDGNGRWAKSVKCLELKVTMKVCKP